MLAKLTALDIRKTDTGSEMTSKLFNTFPLLLIFIWLQPWVNSVNGYMLNKGLPSIIGPIFYIAGLLFFLVIPQNRRRGVLLAGTSLFVYVYLYHYSVGSSSLSDMTNYLKIVFPLIVCAAIRGMPLSNERLTRLIHAVNTSAYVYCALIVFSFLIGYKSRHGSGYFGFVDGNNDLTVLLLLWFSFSFWIEKFGVKARKEVVFLSFAFTYSKAILFMIPAAIINYLRRFSAWSFAGAGLTIILALFVANKIFQRTFMVYYVDALANGRWIDWIQDEMFWRLVTFGRSDYLITAHENGAFAWPNIILGNGLNGMNRFLVGKIGIEADLFDAIAQHGLPGLIVLVLFYYMPLFFSDIGWRAKSAFAFVILYSITGGHFYNNPLVGFYYGLYLGLVLNKSITASFSQVQEIA